MLKRRVCQTMVELYCEVCIVVLTAEYIIMQLWLFSLIAYQLQNCNQIRNLGEFRRLVHIQSMKLMRPNIPLVDGCQLSMFSS